MDGINLPRPQESNNDFKKPQKLLFQIHKMQVEECCMDLVICLFKMALQACISAIPPE